jgi:hypothetical protein
MALTTDEQELLDFALSSLPPWFSAPERDFAIEGGMAKQAGAARAQNAYWFGQALISTATGPTADTPDWLGQHAKDRGTRRQAGESDEALRIRLRQYPDALTRPLLLAIAQGMIDDAGVSGTVAMLELRKDRAFFGVNEPMSGTGGTFVSVDANTAKFTPDVLPWPRPPFQGAALAPPVTYKLVISGASNAFNNGTHPVQAMVGDAAEYLVLSMGAGHDATVSWRVDRYDEDDNLLTEGSGRARAYLSRGFRMGAGYPTILLTLPYGTSAALAASVLEAMRQRKAAGVRVIVERRLTP